MRPLVLAVAVIAASAPIAVSGPGSWSLAQLGAGKGVRTVAPGEELGFRFRAERRVLVFVHLHASVVLDAARLRGDEADLDASVGDGICVSDIVHLARSRGVAILSFYAGGGMRRTGNAARPSLVIDETNFCTYH